MEATREAPPPSLSLEQLVLLKTFLDALEGSTQSAGSAESTASAGSAGGAGEGG